MKILLAVLLLSSSLCGMAIGADALAQLRDGYRSFPRSQYGLKTWVATVDVDRSNEPAASSAKDTSAADSLPERFALRKYWSRQARRSLVRAVSPIVMRDAEWLDSYVRHLELDLENFLLPADQVAQRSALLDQATVTRSDALIGDVRLRIFSLVFSRPTTVGEAFYSSRLDLPREKVLALSIEFDVNRGVIQRLEIQTVDQLLTLEVRYLEVNDGYLPEDILITSPDGRIEDRIKTRFDLIEGYWLPVKQSRVSRKGDRQLDAFIKFRNFTLNGDLPADVQKVLTGE